jgi:hypothetical protein
MAGRNAEDVWAYRTASERWTRNEGEGESERPNSIQRVRFSVKGYGNFGNCNANDCISRQLQTYTLDVLEIQDVIKKQNKKNKNKK